ncbi:Uncharacterised protein [Halioglobus japonicus]|nr:Uncharacterised protein [Halioglobus japonicus]
MKKWLIGIVATVVLLFAAVCWLLFFSARPPVTTDPATLAGDGGAINYCELPVLQGNGKMAEDIPKANTPGCAYDHFPLPILAECVEPLSEGAADIRGLWLGVSGKVGHVERVEQCGSRTVITSAGIIHDGGPNSSAGENSNDTEGSVIFTIGDTAYCNRTSASMTWNEGILEFHLLGWGPLVVSRYLSGEQLVWEYVDGSTTRMDRICTLPQEHRIPKPRGPRYKLF